MLSIVVLSHALAAPPPSPGVHLAWKGSEHRLEVRPPEGHEVALDAPADLTLAWNAGTLVFGGFGADLGSLPTPDLRGQALTGSLSVSLCAKADGTCTPTTWALSGSGGDGKKGRVDLALAQATDQHEDHSPFNQAADATIEAAFAEAEATGKPLLLDFSAVWCPPCNLLSAEVLHAPQPPAVLEDYVVAVVDVDHPSSNDLKNRYDVGGYPTVVVADADGTERSRMVGYPGRDAVIDWLAAAGTSSDAADIAAGAASVSPERALELAWMLLQDRRTETAAPFVERGAEVDNAMARRVRTMVEATADDARWLLENDLDHIGDWFGVAMDLKASEPELARAISRQAVRRLDGPALADAFYVRAEVTGDEADYEAAASALRTAMTGDPEADRGHLTWLAHLTAEFDLDGAMAILDDARARWPDEPTWDLTGARLLSGAERHEEALAVAQRGHGVAWGDNRLRTAHAVAEQLVALERPEEAVAVIDEALSAPVPDEGLDVRTHRYRKRLEELRPSDDDGGSDAE